MVGAVMDVIAPRALIIPNQPKEHQKISGAIWISGATLEFLSCDGADTVVTLA